VKQEGLGLDWSISNQALENILIKPSLKTVSLTFGQTKHKSITGQTETQKTYLFFYKLKNL